MAERDYDWQPTNKSLDWSSGGAFTLVVKGSISCPVGYVVKVTSLPYFAKKIFVNVQILTLQLFNYQVLMIT